jgi:hypothetical protein
MKTVSEKSGFDLLGQSKYFDNASQMIKMWEEMAARGIQSENDLNNLKLSNLTRLGLLKQEQEKKVLETALAANEKLIQQRAELMRKQADEEAAAEKAKRIAAITEADETLRAARIAAIEEEVNADTEARKKQIDEIVEYEFAERKKELEKELKDAKKRKKKELEAEKKEKQEENKEAYNNLFGKQKEGETISEWKARQKEARKELFAKTEEGGGKAAGLAYLASNLTSALSNFAKQLETQMDEIAGKKSAIDTRLQGSSNKTSFGSYWDKMTQDITSIAGVSPLVKQSAIADRVAEMVGKGISFNVEQRAVLDVVKDKIATTFDAANGTLLRLVKIQQQDTTAGRLGMESALTAFLNNMYETTEYMQGLATTVKNNLEEAMSLMSGENALSFEYQIQKWLGSLSSVGMSDGAVQGLAGVLGQVAAGKLEGITGGGQGNLVIMAANQAGVNMSDILNNGLDETTTNTLMNSMVDYLAKIYNDAGNSKVIQQQIASVYGLSASDLKAAVNLSNSRAAVAKDGLDYSGAMARLNSMADSMYKRTSMGEMLSNVWDNAKYSMAAGMANNPVTYALYKASGLLKDTTGGINFGVPMVMGNGMPITFNVADLMRTGALAGGALGSMGLMISGLAKGAGSGSGMLKAIGVTSGASVVTRGTGAGLSTAGGATVSESGSMVGNSNSDDITSKTMTDQNDSNKQETASAVDESDEVKLSDVDSHVCTIIEILRNISDGTSILKVAVDGDVRISQESITQMAL